MASADSADELRPKVEITLKGLEGELLSALQRLGDEGWNVTQLLPQPDGKMLALVQRRKLLIATDVNIPLPILNG